MSIADALARLATRRSKAAHARPLTRSMWIVLTWVTLAALPGQVVAADPPPLVLPVLLAETPAQARAESPDPPGLGKRDLWFGVATIASLALAASFDENIKDRFPESSDKGKPVADFVRPLGSTNVIGSGVVTGWVAGKLFHNPRLESASVRSGISIVAAAAVTQSIKIVTGRARPDVEPVHFDRFKPFSFDDSNQSFPSGHATIAFAAATAISRETDARWAPYVTFPTAALVCWSRLRDNKHWLSDVVGGAAVGYWVTDRTEDFMRARWGDKAPFGATITPGADGPMIGMRVEF